jgi:formiminotetrahydrofolate cyclodeaminase
MHPDPDDPTRDLAGTTIASLFSAAVSQPTPGGGCVTAICGYLGLSLLLKSIRVSSRKQTETAYAPIEKKLLALAEQLLQAAQADSDSFAQFMKALQLSKDTEAEKTARQHAMHQAAVGATEAALNILDLGNEVLDCAHQVQFRVLPMIRADETACVELISAMNITARDNARTNLNGMADAEALQRRLQQAVERYDSLLAACHSAP